MTSVIVSVKSVEESIPAPRDESSTFTVTVRVGAVSKSRFVPLFKNSSVPSISNKAASSPDKDRTFVPVLSSATLMSAILIREPVEVDSGIDVADGLKLTVGDEFTSRTFIEKDFVSSGVPPTSASSTTTFTFSTLLVSKSRAAPSFKYSFVLESRNSNKAASSPVSVKPFVPMPSSFKTTFATCTPPLRSASSKMDPRTVLIEIVGAEFTWLT